MFKAQSDIARTLKPTLGFWALTIYGVGDILGAGIYALVGEIAAVAGAQSSIAFAVALVVAGLTGLSYAELGGRFPKSGGEAHFCERAFGSPDLALFVGWLVLCSGIVSMATMSRAFAGYALQFLPGAIPFVEPAAAGLILCVLAGINFWGIRQSSMLNIVFTAIEFAGLVIVIVVGVMFLTNSAPPSPESATPIEATPVMQPWIGVLQGAALAFFAFIGFEDMVNVAEEVKQPKRTIPAAIVTALIVSGAVYMLVVWIATSVVAPADLAASKAPLLEVVKRAAPAFPPILFTVIAIFAVSNTGLLNFITASRLLYGMSNQRLAPQWLARVHPTTRTPSRSILVVLLTAIALAWSGTLQFLAGTTSFLVLLIFLSVNLALLRVRYSKSLPSSGFRVPIVVPIVAAITSVALVFFLPVESFHRVFVLLGIGLVLVFVRRFSTSREESSETGRS